MKNKLVLITGANGYIGNAVAKAFVRAGWKTFGLIRDAANAKALMRNEIFPIIGTPEDLNFINTVENVFFDVIISNTEDWNNPESHLAKVETMLYELAKRSADAGVRPLIMFTSGCKDYGMISWVHGDANLSAHTESSPILPPEALTKRADFGVKLLEDETPHFDKVVLRPTIVYGNSSSHYGTLFELAASSGNILKIISHPNAIMHSLHIDDCADAYVALAEHPHRNDISNEAFNISNKCYETAEQVAKALAHAYRLEVEFSIPQSEMQLDLSAYSLFNFSQWVDSTKLRVLTGWEEKRMSFIDGIEQYRMAYEASLE